MAVDAAGMAGPVEVALLLVRRVFGAGTGNVRATRRVAVGKTASLAIKVVSVQDVSVVR